MSITYQIQTIWLSCPCKPLTNKVKKGILRKEFNKTHIFTVTYWKSTVKFWKPQKGQKKKSCQHNSQGCRSVQKEMEFQSQEWIQQNLVWQSYTVSCRVSLVITGKLRLLRQTPCPAVTPRARRPENKGSETGAAGFRLATSGRNWTQVLISSFILPFCQNSRELKSGPLKESLASVPQKPQAPHLLLS